MTPLAGPQTVSQRPGFFNWVFPKKMVSSCSVNPRRTVEIDSIRTLSSIPWCWIWGYTLLSVSRRFASSSSSGCLRNNDPSQRSDHNSGVGRCRWWCASSGEPCDIVGRAVDSGLVESGGSPALTHAWFLALGCAPASEHIVEGGFLRFFWHILGRVHAGLQL